MLCSQQNLCVKLLLVLIWTHYWNYFFTRQYLLMIICYLKFIIKILKKYCDNISILSSICFHFLSFSFFSCFFSRHTYSHISHPLLFFLFSFFFSTFHFQNLPFYFFLQLSPFLLFFFSFSTIIFKYTQTGIERKEKSPLLHHTATAAPPPHHHCSTTHIRLYFFSWSFIVVLFFFFFLFLIYCCFLFWF